jgi:hypothetical protein
MMAGSKGLGGRRYQITAALLTYAAVSMAAVPIQIVLSSKHEPTQQEQAQREQEQLEKENGQQPALQKEHRSMGIGAAIGYLALIGLASPFLELQNPIYGLIGLVILFVGIQIAWKMTAGRPPLEVFGPFNAARPA